MTSDEEIVALYTGAAPNPNTIMLRFWGDNTRYSMYELCGGDIAEEVRHYYIVCPKCKTAQRMVFSQIWWPEMCSDAREIVRKSLARYECCECKSRLDDYHRNMAVRMGYWKADEHIEKAQVIGFQLPAWYSPFVSLSNVVAAHIRGKDDVGKRYVFVTQYEAEVYREAITPKAEARVLEHKTDIPPLIVPRNAVALTCGIDSQKVGFWYVLIS